MGPFLHSLNTHAARPSDIAFPSVAFPLYRFSLQIADIVGYLDVIALCQLMLASRTFYAFCNVEELWKQVSVVTAA